MAQPAAPLPRTPQSSAEEVAARCLQVLGRRPAGLICDIDGVLSAIAPTPGEAFVGDEIRAALTRLVPRLDLLAIVSGRAVADAEAMVGVAGASYVGNHGMERSLGGVRSVHAGAEAAAGAIAAALDDVAAMLAAAPEAGALLIENKGITGTVHYRLATDQEAARALVLPAVAAAAAAHGLVVTEGRLIVELRPNLVVNKGTAITELVAERRLRGIVSLGDDVTDVDGFVALRRLREAGEVAALCVGVLATETPTRVLETMDVGIAGVGAVAELLDRLAEVGEDGGAWG